MKKFLLSIALFAAGAGSNLFAYDLQVDDLYYDIIDENSVAVVANSDAPYTGEIIIPATITSDDKTYTVTAVGFEAFYLSSITKATLPETITEIRDYAFAYCWSLTEVNIPAAVTLIGERAFSMCGKVTDFTLPEGLKTIGPSAFISCTSNPSIKIPDSVESLGDYAFYRNLAATSLTIGRGIKDIDSYTFSTCDALTEVVVPEGVESIGKFAFNNCPKLKSITLPQSLKFIDDYAVNATPSLTDITFPDNVEYVGRRIFGQSAWENSCPEGLITINDYVAYLQKGDLPENSEIELPASIRVLAGSAFEQQVKLTAITLPENLLSIGSYAFWYCNSLAELTVPDHVTVIGDNALQYCVSLKKLSLGRNVAKIGALAFSSTSLTEITSLNPEPPVLANTQVFDIDAYDTTTLKVGESAKAAYSTALGWQEFVNIATFDDSTDGIDQIENDGSDITVGIDGLVTAGGNIVTIYNLNGIIVAQGIELRLPDRGVYIAVAGNKAIKIKY